MKYTKLITWGLVVLTVILAVISYILLPDTVVTQLSFGSSGVTTMSKPTALIIPTLLSAGGAVFAMFNKDNQKVLWKSLLVSVIGIVVFVIMLLVNLMK